MAQVVNGIDHLVMVVRDLGRASADLRELGFGVTPGGRHADGRTENALIGLADGSYIELVAFRSDVAAKDHQWEWALADGGFADVALSVPAVAPFPSRFDALGLSTRGPVDGGRRRPDGVDIAWRTLRALNARWLPFLIEDVTPRGDRVPAPSAQGGAPALIGVTVGAHDLGAATETLRRLLGDPVDSGLPEVLFKIGPHALTLRAIPLGARERVIEALLLADERFPMTGRLPRDRTHGARMRVVHRA